MDNGAFEISGNSAHCAGNPLFSSAVCKQLFDALYDGVFFVDKELKILYWNNGAEMLTGYTPDAMLGRYYNSGLIENTNGAGCDLCESECPVNRALETGQPQYKRVFFRHKDRRRIAIVMHTIPLKDDRGKSWRGRDPPRRQRHGGPRRRL